MSANVDISNTIVLASRKQLKFLNDLSFQTGCPFTSPDGKVIAATEVAETKEIISHFDLDTAKVGVQTASTKINEWTRKPVKPATASQIERALNLAKLVQRTDEVTPESLAGKNRRELDTLLFQMGSALRAARAEAESSNPDLVQFA